MSLLDFLRSSEEQLHHLFPSVPQHRLAAAHATASRVLGKLVRAEGTGVALPPAPGDTTAASHHTASDLDRFRYQGSRRRNSAEVDANPAAASEGTGDARVQPLHYQQHYPAASAAAAAVHDHAMHMSTPAAPGLHVEQAWRRVADPWSMQQQAVPTTAAEAGEAAAAAWPQHVVKRPSGRGRARRRKMQKFRGQYTRVERVEDDDDDDGGSQSLQYVTWQ